VVVVALDDVVVVNDTVGVVLVLVVVALDEVVELVVVVPNGTVVVDDAVVVVLNDVVVGAVVVVTGNSSPVTASTNPSTAISFSPRSLVVTQAPFASAFSNPRRTASTTSSRQSASISAPLRKARAQHRSRPRPYAPVRCILTAAHRRTMSGAPAGNNPAAIPSANAATLSAIVAASPSIPHSPLASAFANSRPNFFSAPARHANDTPVPLRAAPA
jgi:hypothetical protein